jgi:hypothetical protein
MNLYAFITLPGCCCCARVLQEACIQLQHCATNPQLPASKREQYSATLHSIRAVVFYSTPHQPVPRLALPEYEYVLPDLAPVCRKFTVLCSAHGWKTLGVGAAVQVCCLLQFHCPVANAVVLCRCGAELQMHADLQLQCRFYRAVPVYREVHLCS